jgi:hypothetical protein
MNEPVFRIAFVYTPIFGDKEDERRKENSADETWLLPLAGTQTTQPPST